MNRKQQKAMYAKRPKFLQDLDRIEKRRNKLVAPKWNNMNKDEKLEALTRSGVAEKAMFGLPLQSRVELANLKWNKLPHYAKTDLAFHHFKVSRF